MTIKGYNSVLSIISRVNVTIGQPIIRTSVDHGVALEKQIRAEENK